MNVKTRHIILSKYKVILGVVYRASKKLTRYLSNHDIFMSSLLEGLRLSGMMTIKNNVIDARDVKNYREKWKVISSRIPRLFMSIYPAFSGVKSSDYVPDTLFFTHIEPILNNVAFSRSFADKNLYSLLIDDDVLPQVPLRKMHGTYYNHSYERLEEVNNELQRMAGSGKNFILKYSISSQGGKNIAVLKSDNGNLYHNDVLIDKQWLDKYYGENFLIQELVWQHPFYSKFNQSSLNTLRVYTYRSVKDEKVNVLHSILRVGKQGETIDNISMGGRACGITADGKLNGLSCDINGNLYDKVGEVNITRGKELYKFEDVMNCAISVAQKQFYTRLIGFDFCVDEKDRIRLIEINNYDVGVDILQQCNGPLFGQFTDEIIEFCSKNKKSFRYIIR